MALFKKKESYICPNCGSAMEYHHNTKVLKCGYCGMLQDMDFKEISGKNCLTLMLKKYRVKTIVEASERDIKLYFRDRFIGYMSECSDSNTLSFYEKYKELYTLIKEKEQNNNTINDIKELYTQGKDPRREFEAIIRTYNSERENRVIGAVIVLFFIVVLFKSLPIGEALGGLAIVVCAFAFLGPRQIANGYSFRKGFFETDVSKSSYLYAKSRLESLNRSYLKGPDEIKKLEKRNEIICGEMASLKNELLELEKTVLKNSSKNGKN